MQQMGRWTLLLAGLLVVLLASAAIAQEGDSTGDAQRTADVSDNVVDIGEEIAVTGSGWPATQPVSATVCGNLALKGSLDCAQAANATTLSNAEGEFSTLLVISAPPVDCPCVVHVAAVGAIGRHDVPITINGHPVSDIERPTTVADPKYTVTITSVDGSGPWLSWFGASATRTAEIEVTNTGTVPLKNAQGFVTAGRSPNSSRVVSVFEVDELGPGQSTVVVEEIKLPSPNFGGFWATATLDAAPSRFAGSAPTSTFPWGILILAIALLQFPIWKGRNWMKARFADIADASAAVQVPPSAQPYAAAAAFAGSAAAVKLAPDDSNRVPLPIPIAMETTSSWSGQVPVRFEPVEPGSVPVVTVEFEPAHDESDAPSIRGIVVGGDIELRMRAVAAEAGIRSVPPAADEVDTA